MQTGWGEVRVEKKHTGEQAVSECLKRNRQLFLAKEKVNCIDFTRHNCDGYMDVKINLDEVFTYLYFSLYVCIFFPK